MVLDDEEAQQLENLYVDSKTKMPNLMSKENIKTELETFAKTDLDAKHADSEVNKLINTIVGDVITSAMHSEASMPQQVLQQFETNYMSLEQEISQLEEKENAEGNEGEISFIDNGNSVVYGKSDSSAVVIDEAEEATVESTNEILIKTEKILSGSSSSLKVTDNNGKIVSKEPPVDCFSCTIS